MELTLAQNLGVDISKDAFDVAVHPAGQTFRVANDRDGHLNTDTARPSAPRRETRRL
jgi:hypothetical protein